MKGLFSSETKEELCRLEPDSVCCLLAELSGIVSAAGSVIYRGGGRKRLSIETENTAVARRAFKLLRDVFDVQPELVTLRRARLGGRSAHRIEVEGDEASFVLEGCGIDADKIERFEERYDSEFGVAGQVPVANLVNRTFEVRTPDVVIKVAPDKSELIETRIIDGMKYILIRADEGVEVNGVNISIEE